MPSHLGGTVAVPPMHKITTILPTEGSVVKPYSCQSMSSLIARGCQHLMIFAWKSVRTASGSCRQTEMSTYFDSTRLFIIIHLSAYDCPSHRVDPFQMASQCKGLTVRAYE